MLTRVYRREFRELQVSILSRQNLSPIVNLHLKAAGLHLRLSAFFDSSTTQGYMDDLMSLWRAVFTFLDLVFELESPSADQIPGGILRYASNYILQTIVAACFALLKLLSSFFSSEIKEFDRGRSLFHRTIQAIHGNTTALFCALVCIALVMTGSPGSPWIWSLPFLFTFIGGVFADAFESPRSRIAMASAGAIVLLQAVLCIVSLSGMI